MSVISIMCPNCRKFLTKSDSKDKNTHKLMCRKCRKWIWWVPSTYEFEIHDVPERTQSSGKRFY